MSAIVYVLVPVIQPFNMICTFPGALMTLLPEIWQKRIPVSEFHYFKMSPLPSLVFWIHLCTSRDPSNSANLPSYLPISRFWKDKAEVGSEVVLARAAIH